MTEDQLEDIDLLFADNSNKWPTQFFHDQKVVKKVYDRVVYLKRKDLPAKLAQTEEQPSEEKRRRWTSGETPSSLSSKTKTKWDAFDEELIEAAFQKCEKCPWKSEIEATLAGDPQLAEIVERNTFTRCYEKVKNIFKKRIK